MDIYAAPKTALVYIRMLVSIRVRQFGVSTLAHDSLAVLADLLACDTYFQSG